MRLCTTKHSTAKHSKAQQSKAKHSTTLQSTAQHSTAKHSTAQHSKALQKHSKAEQSTAKHSKAQQSTAQHIAAQHCTAQYIYSSYCVTVRVSVVLKSGSPTTVLFRTTLTRTITQCELLILLGSNHLLCYSTYMLLVGWEVRIGKNCDRSLEKPQQHFQAPITFFIFFSLP